MSFHYSTHTYKTTHRPTNHFSHLNEDAHCDNEVNLILEKNYNQPSNEQSTEKFSCKEQTSVVVNQTNPYYFMPIREQTSSTALAGHHVTGRSLLSDLHRPSTLNLFDESSSSSTYFPSIISTMNSSTDTTTVNPSNQANFTLNDADLAALFVSSLISTTTPSPSPATLLDHLTVSDDNNETSSNPLDEVFFHQVTDLACGSSSRLIDSQPKFGPPPGFENFRFDTTTTPSDLLLSQPTNDPSTSSISNAALQTPVSSSDTINFSQLLQSTVVDTQQQQAPIVGHLGAIRSSSSSHSSFTSDEQSIFFPMSNHPYSSPSSSSTSILHASSQIFSTTIPTSASTSTATNSVAKPHAPNSLSLNHNHHHHPHLSSSSSSSLSRVPSASTTGSPLPKNNFDTDTKLNDGEQTPNHIFTSPHSIFGNGNTDFPPSKSSSNKINAGTPQQGQAKQSSIPTRTSSSSPSSSTSSSIDDALIQLSQQQQKQQQKLVTRNKLFNDDANSIFHFPSLPTNPTIDKQQQQLAVHENIHFLASMATGSTPATPDASWQTSNPIHSNTNNSLDLNNSLPQKLLRKHHLASALKSNPINMQDLLENLNELCYRGFDELNSLIQEQRWVQNYVTGDSTSISSPSSPSFTLNGSNCCSSRVLVVAEYFIFKCKKVEATATHVFESLVLVRPELRLRERTNVFKLWKEAINNAQSIHLEEENRLRLSTEQPHSYYMTESVLQAAFDRVCYAIRQVGSMTQQTCDAYRYATLNVFQSMSRQQGSRPMTIQATSPSMTQSPFSSMQQQPTSTSTSKSSSTYRPTITSLRSTP